jgi:hypothetical protein
VSLRTIHGNGHRSKGCRNFHASFDKEECRQDKKAEEMLLQVKSGGLGRDDVDREAARMEGDGDE